MDLDIEWEEETVKQESPFTTIPMDIDIGTVACKVLSMKDKWIDRSDKYPFFTLGRCAYLDGKTDAYYNNLKKENEMMIHAFAELYTEIGIVLNSVFAEDIYLTTELRVPGFHIFPSDKKFLAISGKWHQDHPHVTLGLDNIDSYAFTLAVKLPKSGGGMDYFDDFHQAQHLAYNEKDLVIHSGQTIHRIAGMKEYTPNEYRITLQGHIVRRDGLLEAFF
mgnify:FL=1|tara:strand:+ start:255 stop:914 length:660 start_codon:yes stop_codon:yes gene_type:complete